MNETVSTVIYSHVFLPWIDDLSGVHPVVADIMGWMMILGFLFGVWFLVVCW